jgi:Polyketide cyclase / dehydrase and lipid transport
MLMLARYREPVVTRPDGDRDPGGNGGYCRIVPAPSLSFSESIVIARSPQDLYDMVADITRMGEWSPVCKACWWDEGAGAQPGAWFTGRNETPERTWETRSQVVAAEPGLQFAFTVFGDRVRWGYTFTPADGGTRVTESWDFLPAGITAFQERYGADADAQIAARAQAARSGIPQTLAALKRVAEPAAEPGGAAGASAG